jgi:hypothetical protein
VTDLTDAKAKSKKKRKFKKRPTKKKNDFFKDEHDEEMKE